MRSFDLDSYPHPLSSFGIFIALTFSDFTHISYDSYPSPRFRAHHGQAHSSFASARVRRHLGIEMRGTGIRDVWIRGFVENYINRGRPSCCELPHTENGPTITYANIVTRVARATFLCFVGLSSCYVSVIRGV